MVVYQELTEISNYDEGTTNTMYMNFLHKEIGIIKRKQNPLVASAINHFKTKSNKDSPFYKEYKYWNDRSQNIINSKMRAQTMEVITNVQVNFLNQLSKKLKRSNEIIMEENEENDNFNKALDETVEEDTDEEENINVPEIIEAAPEKYNLFLGIEYNNNDTKELKGLNKLVSGAIKSIEHVCALTDLKLPIPQFIVRSYVSFVDGKIRFESVIKLSDNTYIRRTYTAIPVPKTARLLKELFTKIDKLYEWREAVIYLIKQVVTPS
ncbi:hypothetical protein INT48_008150 [Thamnidium elegans]|uniref:Uncharacterized protein n=1 Tax=Thamnidium elegans TaxID=101142 RepID=A0A8H7SX75_9FUNG|nr:hypothetical protein INT48_008150 [Thamnidium elegans]